LKYRSEIDGLRAIAVMPVILFHAGIDLFSGGFIGVDIFFVISGYLITTIIINDMDQGRFSLVNFYERRARRILPALFFVTLVSVPFAWGLLRPYSIAEMGNSMVAVATFTSNIFFWQEIDYFASVSELKPLLHTWSLAVEEQFYLLFPLFLLLLWRLGKSTIVSILLMTFIGSLLIAHWGSYHKPIAAFYLLPTRGWELLLGVFTAFYLQKRPIASTVSVWNHLLGLLGIILIGVAVFYYDEVTPFPGGYALLPTLGTALIILFANRETLVGKVLSVKPLVGLGLISYSAYLWHQPLFAFMRHIKNGDFENTLVLILVMTTLLLSFLSWRFIEQPFRNKTVGRKRFIYTAVIFWLLIIILGVIGSKTHWFRAASPVIQHKGWMSCPAEKINDGVCELGNREAKDKIVAYGDSHLGHVVRQLVDQLGNDYAIDVISTYSCFMGESLRYNDIGDRDACDKMVGKLETYKATNPVAVITSQRWHGYQIIDEEGIEAAINDRMNAFGMNPEHLIILGSTANIPFECEMAKYRPMLPPADCPQNIKTKLWSQTFIDTTRVMNTPDHVHFVYPYSHICPNDECTVIKDHVAYYMDQHHLSFEGSESVVKEISDIVRQ
jgi:peptidoglycan/LPS O-acetylase OafA/YrhL